MNKKISKSAPKDIYEFYRQKFGPKYFSLKSIQKNYIKLQLASFKLKKNNIVRSNELTLLDVLFINLATDKFVRILWFIKELHIQSITHQVKKLLKKNLIEKTANEKDGRSYLVRLTEEGLKIKEELIKAFP